MILKFKKNLVHIAAVPLISDDSLSLDVYNLEGIFHLEHSNLVKMSNILCLLVSNQQREIAAIFMGLQGLNCGMNPRKMLGKFTSFECGEGSRELGCASERISVYWERLLWGFETWSLYSLEGSGRAIPEVFFFNLMANTSASHGSCRFEEIIDSPFSAAHLATIGKEIFNNPFSATCLSKTRTLYDS